MTTRTTVKPVTSTKARKAKGGMVSSLIPADHYAPKGERKTLAGKDVLATMDKLIKVSERFDQDKEDFTGQAAQFSFSGKGKIRRDEIIRLPSLSSEPSPLMDFDDNAFGQMLSRMSETFFGEGVNTGMDKVDWRTIQQRFPEQFNHMMNELFQTYTNSKDGNVLVRAYRGQVRAFFTGRYQIVNNTELLKLCREMLSTEVTEAPELEIARSEISPNNMLLQTVWKNPAHKEPGGKGGSHPYGAGVVIMNGETGEKGIKAVPIIWRRSCKNSIFLDWEHSLNLRHFGDPHKILTVVKTHFYELIEQAAEGLEWVYKAEYEKLPSIGEVVRGIAAEKGWSDSIVDAVNQGTERRKTRMGLINGITYAAHTATGNNLDLQVDMSTLAGAMLRWDIERVENYAEKAK